MRYKIFRMSFQTGVHFGKEKLVQTQYVFQADTLFSALCHEALFAYGEEGIDKLVRKVKCGGLLFSDGLPYIGERLYLPRPILVSQQETNHNSVMKKNAKKLKYIAVDEMASYMKGTLDIEAAVKGFEGKLGSFSLRTQVQVMPDADSRPYPMEVFHFHKNCGLYFILGYEEKEDGDFVNELVSSLSYQGIGGRRSSGLGKFTVVSGNELLEGDLSAELQNQTAQIYMSLSVCMAAEEELGEVLLGATYMLQRRGGFISSVNYAATPVRKNDMYVFCSGSCFERRFQGDIFDVSQEGKHAVYRYAKPMLLGVM